jgi:ATP-dependent DNA ligase
LSIIDDGKERKVPTGFIDITARDRDGTTVAIELKSDHQRAQGRAFFDKACGLSLEGIVSKRADTPYTPG